MTLLEATSGADRPGAAKGRPYHAAAGPPGGRTGTGPDWSRPGIEPSLEDVLEDPIVHLVMRRDRLTPGDVLKAIEDVRRRLAKLAD